MSDRFVGRGWAFPVRADPVTGGIATVGGDREIAESIRLILGTSYGERDATTAGRIGYEVRVSLNRWEPRIRVVDVVVTLNEDDVSRFDIEIWYVTRSDNDPRNLVFPFYVIPEEPVALEAQAAGAGE
jgi:Bacteriophage baseplate protein W